jgi:hypothetical protein
MAYGKRGALYGVIVLLAFGCGMVSLFSDVGTYKVDVMTNQTVEGWISVWTACATLMDCSSEPCLLRDLCAKTTSRACAGESRMYNAAQVLGVMAVVSTVPGLVIATLDFLGKGPTILCLSPRGVMIVGRLGSCLVSLTYAILVTVVVHVSLCDNSPPLVKVGSWDGGSVIPLAYSCCALNLVAVFVAAFMSPPKPSEDSTPTKHHKSASRAKRRPEPFEDSHMTRNAEELQTRSLATASMSMMFNHESNGPGDDGFEFDDDAGTLMSPMQPIPVKAPSAVERPPAAASHSASVDRGRKTTSSMRSSVPSRSPAPPSSVTTTATPGTPPPIITISDGHTASSDGRRPVSRDPAERLNARRPPPIDLKSSSNLKQAPQPR